MNINLKNNNYLYVPSFIDKTRAKKLANEFKVYTSLNFKDGDSQAPNSRSSYDFLPFLRLLVEKIPHVSELAEEDLLPTYTYARVYLSGSDLKIHKDRPACEVSLTINLEKDTNWPIFITRPDGKTSELELEPGDAMMYLGCVADHWREGFEGKEYTQLFMHYVRSFGDYSWAYFDKIKQSPQDNYYADDIAYSII